MIQGIGKNSNAVSMLARARELAKHRAHDQALHMYRELTARFPAYPEGWFERSGVENGRGNTLAAITCGKAALGLVPSSSLYRTHLAQLQVNYGFWGDAISTLGPLRDKQPKSFEPRIANGVGAVLSLAGLEGEAQPWFECAARMAPDQRNYAFNQAQGLVHCGQLKESSEAFDRLLARFPDFAKAHWSRATLTAGYANEQRVEALRKELPLATSPGDEVYYCFALFALLDALNRPHEAFIELEHGLNLQRALMRYEGEDVEVLGRLKEAAARLPPTPAFPVDPLFDGVSPIFIVGMPRSGTTLVERVLSNHPDVEQGGEFICFSAALREHYGIETPGFVPRELAAALAAGFDPSQVGARYLELTAFKRKDYRFFTDKLPFNFMLLPWIAAALPSARFLHVQRSPMDTCFSNLKQLFSRHYAASYSQRDICEYYLAYDNMMRAWDELLPGRILQVRYETLVSKPEDESKRIFEFCGLAPAGDAWRIERNTRPVATASAAQVRDVIHNRGIGAWRRYEEELRPLLDLMGLRPEFPNEMRA